MARKKISTHKVRIIILIVIAILLGALSFYTYNYLQNGRFIKQIWSKSDVTNLPFYVEQERILTPTPKIKPVSIRIPILMYHYVEYVKDKGDTIRQSLNTNPYTLEQQLITLKEADYTFITPKDLMDMLEADIPIPSKPIILSFDDGYRDFYTHAFPLLKKYNAKAVQYIITGFTGRRDFLTKEQIEEISDSNLVEIGAHTVHHLWLKQLNPKTAKYEIEESKSALEKIVHEPVVSFAYPYGAFDAQAEKFVKDAGYTNAVSTVPGIEAQEENRYYLFRLRPGGRTGQALLYYLEKSKF